MRSREKHLHPNQSPRTHTHQHTVMLSLIQSRAQQIKKQISISSINRMFGLVFLFIIIQLQFAMLQLQLTTAIAPPPIALIHMFLFIRKSFFFSCFTSFVLIQAINGFVKHDLRRICVLVLKPFNVNKMKLMTAAFVVKKAFSIRHSSATFLWNLVVFFSFFLCLVSVFRLRFCRFFFCRNGPWERAHNKCVFCMH